MKVLTIPEHCTRTHGANCTRCQLACPAKAISFDEAGAPVIDRDACTKCGVCMGVCDAFSSSSATALRLYDHLRKVAMRGEIVYLTCEENVFPGFEPAKNVTVLPCLACVPPELWTLLLAQNVPVCVACDLKYCEDCPRAAQIGELLFTKAIEIAEAQTGENVHFDRSSALVGSSKKTISGFRHNARAMETRCCCPPESSQGTLPSLPSRPIFAMSSRA